MTDVRAHVYPTAKMAGEEGYAEFNGNPHLAVDIPDGGFTITAKTTEGKRITFAFLPYKTGGPAQAVDVCYHDGDKALNCNRKEVPVFNVIGFGSKPGEPGKFGKHHDFDTRAMTKAAGEDRKIGILCVLMDNEKEK
jgi:hypothetical protein